MEIMFDDLKPEAQERLLIEAGVSRPEEMNWDEVPVTVVEFNEYVPELDDDFFADDTYYGG